MVVFETPGDSKEDKDEWESINEEIWSLIQNETQDYSTLHQHPHCTSTIFPRSSKAISNSTIVSSNLSCQRNAELKMYKKPLMLLPLPKNRPPQNTENLFVQPSTSNQSSLLSPNQHKQIHTQLSTSSCTATETSTATAKSTRRLHISNIPFRYRDSDLKSLLMPFGHVLDTEIIFNNRGSKGFGFATFVNYQSANNAQIALDGQFIEGRPIEVNHATVRTISRQKSAKSSAPAATLKGTGSFRPSLESVTFHRNSPRILNTMCQNQKEEVTTKKSNHNNSYPFFSINSTRPTDLKYAQTAESLNFPIPPISYSQATIKHSHTAIPGINRPQVANIFPNHMALSTPEQFKLSSIEHALRMRLLAACGTSFKQPFFRLQPIVTNVYPNSSRYSSVLVSARSNANCQRFVPY